MLFMLNLARKPGPNRSKRNFISRSELSNCLSSSMTTEEKVPWGPCVSPCVPVTVITLSTHSSSNRRANSSFSIAGFISKARKASFLRRSANVSANKCRYFSYFTKLLTLLVIRNAHLSMCPRWTTFSCPNKFLLVERTVPCFNLLSPVRHQPARKIPLCQDNI